MFFLLRHTKRLPVNKRNKYEEIKSQHKDYLIDGEIMYKFVLEIQSFINTVWYNSDEVLKIGSFI